VFASSAIGEAEHVGFDLVCGSPFPGSSLLASETPKGTESVCPTYELEDLDELEDLNEMDESEETLDGKQSEFPSL
jgi:hypothetical protein